VRARQLGPARSFKSRPRVGSFIWSRQRCPATQSPSLRRQFPTNALHHTPAIPYRSGNTAVAAWDTEQQSTKGEQRRLPLGRARGGRHSDPASIPRLRRVAPTSPSGSLTQSACADPAAREMWVRTPSVRSERQCLSIAAHPLLRRFRRRPFDHRAGILDRAVQPVDRALEVVQPLHQSLGRRLVLPG